MDKRRSQCLEKREEKNYICCHIFHKSYLLASRMPWFFKGLINFWKPFPYTKKKIQLLARKHLFISKYLNLSFNSILNPSWSKSTFHTQYSLTKNTTWSCHQHLLSAEGVRGFMEADLESHWAWLLSCGFLKIFGCAIFSKSSYPPWVVRKNQCVILRTIKINMMLMLANLQILQEHRSLWQHWDRRFRNRMRGQLCSLSGAPNTLL